MNFLSLTVTTLFASALVIGTGAKAEQTETSETVGQAVGKAIDGTTGGISKATSDVTNEALKKAEIAKLQAEIAILDSARLVDTDTRSYLVKGIDTALMVGGGYAVIKLSDKVAKVPVINKWLLTRALSRAVIAASGAYFLFEGVRAADNELSGAYVVSEKKLLEIKASHSRRIQELSK